jgi:hypothetical protein
MDQFLRTKGQNITIVVIGGAWNVLEGGNRDITYDFNYFGNINPEQRENLKIAADHAARKVVPAMRKSWFVEAYFPLCFLKPEIISEAISKDVRLRQLSARAEGGLRIVCAPLEYAFWAKLDLIANYGSAAPTYHYKDAACYLNTLSQRRGSGLSSSEVRGWCHGYRMVFDGDVWHELKCTYEENYRSLP